jgi:hypothetical protein
MARVDEVLELRVEPMLDRWPGWLRDPWQAHLAEMSGQLLIPGEDRPQRRAPWRPARG